QRRGRVGRGGRGSPRRCQWPFQSAADVGIECTHLCAELAAGVAVLQVLLELRRGAAGVGADLQPCLFAAHDAASLVDTSGAGDMPQDTRSLLRARNSRVSTAVEDNDSSRAISSVEKPPRTCSRSGSRYSIGSLMIALRRVNRSPSGSVAFAGARS